MCRSCYVLLYMFVVTRVCACAAVSAEYSTLLFLLIISERELTYAIARPFSR